MYHIPQPIIDEIREWVFSLDNPSFIEEVFEDGGKEIYVSVDMDYQYKKCDIDIWVYIDGIDIGFTGIDILELESEVLDNIRDNIKDREDEQETFDSLRNQ